MGTPFCVGVGFVVAGGVVPPPVGAETAHWELMQEYPIPQFELLTQKAPLPPLPLPLPPDEEMIEGMHWLFAQAYPAPQPTAPPQLAGVPQYA